ncbi:MAG: DUF6044 family protein [Eubacteriales bacterium]|nr:DUF6044 family protein [Eubacteriales bacterium]
MRRFLSFLDRYWFVFLIGGCVGLQALVYLIFREDSYLTVQDNLDLFVAHFQVLSHSGTWFAQGAQVPMLGGISRDYLSGEWNLYNILYVFLPVFWAYMAGYFLKIGIGACSFALLAKDVYGQAYARYRGIAWAAGLCYGMLPLFPAYGIAFASIPLAVFLLRQIYFRRGRRWYAALFVYPFLSYFSYFGFFLLAYLGCAAVILSVRDKKLCGRLFIALPVLAAGYMCFEYRLFGQMLFSDVETIRSTMVESDLDALGVLGMIREAFLTPVFHAASDHLYFVLPVCLLVLLWQAAGALRRRFLGGQRSASGKAAVSPLLLVLLFIVFNCLIYGLYFWGDFRRLFEALVPPLKGFQFNRTVFFNAFLWYVAFFLALKFLCDRGKLFWRRAANLLACVGAAVILLTPAVYNEFYWTCYHQAYRAVKHTEVNLLNFREYYSAGLMEKIKEDIGYQGEYAAGYGLNPAVLAYSGISTLDGYLGFYPQSYKEEFTKLIWPSYERVPEWQTYYGEWGARAYLFAGSGESIYNPYRNQPLSDHHLYLDGEQFARMGGRYLFSRYELDNAEELGFFLRGVYEEEASPYTVFLYEIDKQ